MARPAPAPPDTALETALRALGAGETEPLLPLRIGGAIGAGAGGPRLLESSLGVRIPAYRERQAAHSGLMGDSTHVVFTDAARTTYLWTCHSPWAEGAARYAEFRLPLRIDSLVAHLRELRESPTAGGGAPFEAACDAVLRAYLDAMGVPCMGESSARVLEWIHALDDAASLRRAWRGATELRIVDRAVADPAWLLDAARAQELVMVTLIDRIRTWVDEGGDPTQRRALHRDLRALVAAAESGAPALSARAAFRAEIVRSSVFGFARSATVVRSCRQALLRYAGARYGAAAYFDVEIRRTPAGRDFASCLVADDEPDALAAALRLLKSERRDRGEWSPEEWARAARGVERWRRRLEHVGRYPPADVAAGAAMVEREAS